MIKNLKYHYSQGFNITSRTGNQIKWITGTAVPLFFVLFLFFNNWQVDNIYLGSAKLSNDLAYHTNLWVDSLSETDINEEKLTKKVLPSFQAFYSLLGTGKITDKITNEEPYILRQNIILFQADSSPPFNII